MRTLNLPRLATLALVAATLPALAVVNPYYEPITSRNLFGLKPPPPPEDPAAKEVKPPEPPQKVLLTGITTLMGGKRALMRVQKPAKPPEPAKEVSLILAEGGPAEEEIQVVSIDVAAGTVNILNRGVPQLLDISKDAPAPKAGAAPAPAPAPGAVPRPGIPIPPPPAVGAGPGAGGIVVPPRPVRGGDAAAVNPAVSGGEATGGGVAAGGWTGGKLGHVAAGTPPPLSREEQEILIEAQREAGSPHSVILPPTTLREILNQETNPNPNPVGGPPIPSL
jgi:hypothetical protein